LLLMVRKVGWWTGPRILNGYLSVAMIMQDLTGFHILRAKTP
jgi:hypothetical protein